MFLSNWAFSVWSAPRATSSQALQSRHRLTVGFAGSITIGGLEEMKTNIILFKWIQSLIQSTIAENMAECTFSQDALPTSIENYGIKMTQDHLMIRNFSKINKSTSCLTFIFQKIFVRFLKNFGPQCITGKMYRLYFFRNRGLYSLTNDSTFRSSVFIRRDLMLQALTSEL